MNVFDVLSILGGIGFVLAGVLTAIQLCDYFRRLDLRVTYQDCQPTGNETSLVLYRLSFVNHSSRGRIVYGLDVISKLEGISLIELNEEVDSNLRTVTYSLPNVSRRLPFEEILLFPLDIPPRQSLSKWKAIAVSYHGIAPVSGTLVRFEATAPKGKYRWSGVPTSERRYSLGIKKKILANCEVVLSPAEQESKPRDIYYDL